MKFCLEEYKKYYHENNSKITEASQCAINKPYSKLYDGLTEIIEYINSLVNIPSSEWNDSIKLAFSENMQLCADNLNEVTNSINETGSKIDELYLQLPDDFEELKNSIDEFETEIDNEPKYGKYAYTDPITNIVSHPGYSSDHEKWMNNVQKKKNTCETCKITCENNINLLKQLNGEIINLPNVINNTLGVLFLQQGLEYCITDTTEIQEILNSNSVTYARDSESGKLTVRFSQADGSRWDKTIAGVNLHKAGCGVMSLATALTSALSYQYGCDILVTPTSLAEALDEYGGLGTYFPNGMSGDYKNIAKAVSDIFGVSIVYNSDGSINDNQVTNLTDGSATVVYSCENKSHVAALTGTIDEKFIIADTGSGKAKYVENGTTNFDGGKRFLAVSTTDFTISDGKLCKNGTSQFADIGDISGVMIDGTNYNLEKRSAGILDNGTELFEYFVDME